MAKKGNGIFLVFTDVDPKHEEEFNAWYDTEHLGDLLKLPGFLDAGRYVAAKGGPKYLVVYELASADAEGARAGSLARSPVHPGARVPLRRNISSLS